MPENPSSGSKTVLELLEQFEEKKKNRNDNTLKEITVQSSQSRIIRLNDRRFIDASVFTLAHERSPALRSLHRDDERMGEMAATGGRRTDICRTRANKSMQLNVDKQSPLQKAAKRSTCSCVVSTGEETTYERPYLVPAEDLLPA